MNQENSNFNNKPSSEDEIDLNKLVNSIARGLTYLVRGFFKIFFLLIDTALANIKVILILIFLGILFGVVSYYRATPYYESNMTLGSVYYRGQLMNNSIENLNLLCKENNFKVLSKVLTIPERQAKEIRRLEINPIISPSLKFLIDNYKEKEGTTRYLDSLIINNQDTTFQLTVQIYDTTALQGLDTALVNYLKENKYLKKRIEIERSNLKFRRAKLIKESGNLDTLKRNIALSYRNQAGGRSGTNNVILDDKGTNPIDIYREDFRLFEQQLKIDRLLYINSEIEIITPFVAFGEPKNEKLEKSILKGILSGLGIALLFILFKVFAIGLSNIRRNLNKPDIQ